MTADHIEDVRGRSMADAAVGPCDCDPHIEHCPSCAPYLHEPLKPAGEVGEVINSIDGDLML